MIAPAFTVRYPNRVQALAIVSAVAGRTAEQRAAVVKRAEDLARGGAAMTVGEAVERWFTPEFRARHPEVIEHQIQRVLGNDPAVRAAVEGPEGGRAINRAKARVGHRVTGHPPFPSPPDGR